MSAPSIMNSWLYENGGGFNNDVYFDEDNSGFRIIAAKDLPGDTVIVSCPFGLAITQDLARNAVMEILDAGNATGSLSWSARQWISTYIVFHSIPDLQSKRQLVHRQYIETLPSTAKLRTPLHFSELELKLFRGTNLYNATLDREREWKAEWHRCREFIEKANPPWVGLFTWQKYLTAATYLSSRAFPSSILTQTPTLVHSPLTQPVLLPGIDALNHARGQPVSWVVTYPADAVADSTQNLKISLVLRKPSSKGEELFNNYGPKPNSELILGYGFSIPNNPDDTIIMKIGGIEGNKWEIGRDARGIQGLWQEVVTSFQESPESPLYEVMLDASGMLQEMLRGSLDRLPGEVKDSTGIRPEILTMFQHYLEGQKVILLSMMDFTCGQESCAIEMARNEGIDIILED